MYYLKITTKTILEFAVMMDWPWVTIRTGKEKAFRKTFKEHGLDIIIIIILCNMKIINYLDVNCKLMTKLISLIQNQTTKLNTYLKTQNHPPSVIRQIPLSIESRLSALPYYNKKIFQQVLPPPNKKYW